ncbi:MAG: sodium:proton antiporter [Alphaproteobacteria bacterium]
MTVFQTIAILLTFAAAGSYINKRFLHLPTSVGMMFLTLLMSWAAMLCARMGLIDLTPASAFVSNIDFANVFLHGMLSFLLFAGALHVDLGELRKFRTIVAILATVGVLIAVFVTGTLIWATAWELNFDMPYINALLFGAFIAPTDPVAVIGILKGSPVGKALRLKISSESLLNDGVGVVIFLIFLNFTTHPEAATHIDWNNILVLITWASVGSIALGLSLGWLAYVLLGGIDDYKTEILLTLALASGGYCLAETINVSAPITMVIAGLVIGNHGRTFVMSDKTRKHLDMFWELLDDILNSILFVLIGLEMMVIPLTVPLLSIGLIAIVATLIGRFVSVALPISLMRMRIRFEKGTIRLMTWGGLRGGISIAMALSLPASPYKNIILGMTYLTVVFSVLFQGTTFSHVVKRVLRG